MDDSPQNGAALLSPQITLSPWKPSDRSALVRYLNDHAIYDNTLRIPYPYDEQDADAFLKHVFAISEEHGGTLEFAIRSDDGDAIGGCGFNRLEAGHRATIGYWLGKPFWGQGIMTHAVARLCSLGFEDWNLVRISATVFSSNAASARVLEKCGFQHEGTLRKIYLKEGVPIDAELYALVR